MGYCGGTTNNPTYREVCTGTTGHAEAVEVEYDAAVISYEDLLKVFWKIHNPTQGLRQGWNFGDQYRSAIFCDSESDLITAQASAAAEQRNHRHQITTQIVMLSKFWRAEEYHQQYYAKKGVGSCRI